MNDQDVGNFLLVLSVGILVIAAVIELVKKLTPRHKGPWDRP